MRPLLSLCMIVKDEATNIAETLLSARPHVDRWTILDTGSTDGTQDIVRRVMCDVPGGVFDEPFVDFASTRNRVLEVDAIAIQADGTPDITLENGEPKYNNAVFTLMLSGDEVLEDGDKLRAFLETRRDAEDGAYSIERQSGTLSSPRQQVWPFPLVLRTDGRWRYRRKVHERPYHPSGQEVDMELAPGRVVHTASDPQRRARRIREYDIPVLTAEVADESKPASERAVDMYFLAESHASAAGQYDDDPAGPQLTHYFTAMSLYWRYATMCAAGVTEAERKAALFAYFRYFTIAQKIGLFGPEEMLARLVPLSERMPNTPEVHYMVAVLATQVDARQGMFLAEKAAKIAAEASKRPIDERLPHERGIEWSAWRVAAACAKALKNDRRAKELAERAINAGAPQEAVREFV